VASLSPRARREGRRQHGRGESRRLPEEPPQGLRLRADAAHLRASLVVSAVGERIDVPSDGIAFGLSTPPDAFSEDVVPVGSGGETG
jgi:hypothetical protein